MALIGGRLAGEYSRREVPSIPWWVRRGRER